MIYTPYTYVWLDSYVVLQHLVQLCRFSIESMTSCQAGILEQQHMTTITTQKTPPDHDIRLINSFSSHRFLADISLYLAT
jgi:hypothetical protein